MENFKHRLLEFVEKQYGMSQRKFEEMCEIGIGTISTIKVKGPSAEIVTRISRTCPELNLNWLFRGEDGGPMLNVQAESPQNAPSVSIGTIQTVNIGNWGELVELLKQKAQ